MTLSQLDAVGLLGAFVAWYFQPAGAGINASFANAARTGTRRAGMPSLVDGRLARFVYASRSTPPGWVFGVAWTILYALNALAFYFFWREAVGDSLYTATIILFIVNLFLNKFWSPIFFGWRQPVAALVVAIVLFVTAAIIFGFIAASLGAATASLWLWLPYLIWLGVAIYLNVRFVMAYNELSDEQAMAALSRGFAGQATEKTSSADDDTARAIATQNYEF